MRNLIPCPSPSQEEGREKQKDLIIIGSGPAGLTASIYASRYAIDHIVIGKHIGGQAAESIKIENFPGIKSISGAEWSQKLQDQAENLGGEILDSEAVSIEKAGDIFKVATKLNGEFEAKTVLIASGTKRRKLGAKGEDEFAGRGVAYCATCDGPFFRDKKVAVMGGGDSAATAALYLSDIAEEVYLISIENKLRAEEAWQSQIKKNQKIKIILNNTVEEFSGEKFLEKAILKNEYSGSKELKIDGVFIEIGYLPSDGMIEKLGIEKNDCGYIKVGADMSSSISGAWAAGDITDGSNNFHQLITACAEGAIAANSIHQYLKRN